jgi:hypothetical protein
MEEGREVVEIESGPSQSEPGQSEPGLEGTQRGARETVDAMRAGAEVIYGAPPNRLVNFVEDQPR